MTSGKVLVVLCCLTSEKCWVTSGKFTTSDHLSWVGGRSWDPCPKTADIHQKSTILPTTTMDDPTDPGLSGIKIQHGGWKWQVSLRSSALLVSLGIFEDLV